MKEILIVTNYYAPEIGAASNRIRHMAEGFIELGYKVTVVTPMPNYPTGKIFKGFKGKLIDRSYINDVRIIRLWLFASNSKNKFFRLLAMLSYSFSLLLYFVFNRAPKSVIIQCPPLVVAFTSLVLLGFRQRKLILNVSDLWPIAGLELGALKEGLFVDFLRKIERYNYSKADLILGQSNEILDHVLKIHPKKPTFLYRNYPILKSPKLVDAIKDEGDKIKMVYAGLLGIAQGVLELCKQLDFEKLEFHIYGDGAERSHIEAYIISNPHLPITYHGRLEREKLQVELLKYDLAIIPLKKRIYGSVPSKIFEYAKIGLPMLYFGGGEGEEIIREHKLGFIAKAGDYNNLKKVLNEINRSQLSIQYKKKILTTAQDNFILEHQLQMLSKIIQ